MAGESEAPNTDAAVNDASLLSDDAGAQETAAPGAESAAPEDKASADAKETKPDSATADGGEGGSEAEPENGEASLLDEAENEDGKSPDKADGQADAKKDGAPEAYTAFELPDGMTLDEGALAKAEPVLRDLNLNQAQAQKLVSLYADLAAQSAQSALHERNEAGRVLVADWTKASKAHPDFGGDKLKESTGLFNRAIDEFSDSPEDAASLRNFLRETKISNNPQLRAVLCRAAQKLLPDKLVTADAANVTAPKSVAQRIYPNMPGDNQ